MASIVVTDMVRNQRTNYAHLSMPTFCVLLHLAENIREYRNEWKPGATGDQTATKLHEIHPSRWSTWETQDTILEELPLSRPQLGVHLATLRTWGDITTGTKVVAGDSRTEHTITNRTAENVVLAKAVDHAEEALEGRTLPPIRVVGAMPKMPGLKRRRQDEPRPDDKLDGYRVDEIVTPANTGEAVAALIRKAQAAYEGDWHAEPQPTWVPAPARTAELLERLVAEYVEYARPLAAEGASVITFPRVAAAASDEDVIDAELVEEVAPSDAVARARAALARAQGRAA